jgi:hypothetical protein
MINIAQPNPAAWSPPASGATAPVAAVAAIRPLQENARNGQPGAGREPASPAARADRRADPREIAHTGREAVGEGGRNTTGRAGAERSAAGDLLVRREADQNAKQVAVEQAAEEARRAHRQALLANVWKASAAVVNHVLGRDGATALQPAAEMQASPGRQPLEQLTLPWPVMPQEARATLSRAELRSPEDVVAYDERGNSNLAPLETGVLISRRV